MAGRVNKKFVVTLSLGLLAIFALMAGAGVFLLKNSAKDLAKVGDKKMADKQYDKAVEYFAKAVNKEQTNTIYLNKWRDALRSLAPETMVQYRDYFQQWQNATRQLARVQKDNVAAQREFLELVKGSLSPYEFDRAAQDGMVQEASALINLHTGKPAGGEWETLKRYRGTAKQDIVNYVKDAKPEVAKEAEADLLAALAADPADSETALSLETLYLVLAARANEKSLADQASEYEQKSAKIIAAAAEKKPNEPLLQLAQLRRDFALSHRELIKQRTASNISELARQLQTQLRPQLDGAMASIRAMDAAKITPRIIDQMRSMETFLDPTGKLMFTEEAIELAIAKRPTDAQLWAQKADLLASRENFTGAMEAVQRILALPIPPTSLEGLRLFAMRNNAQYLEALWAARLAGSAKDDQKAPALAKAKAMREKLVALEAPDSPSVMFVDAQLAFVENDNGKANRLLDQYAKAMRNRPNVEALYLQAQVADKLNQPGLAKEKLVALLDSWGITVNNDVAIDETGSGADVGYNKFVFALDKYESHPIVRDMRDVGVAFPLVRTLTTKDKAEKLLTTPEKSFATTTLDLKKLAAEPPAGAKGPLTIGAAATVGKARVVVFGSISWATNSFFSYPGNRDLFLNAFNWMSSDEELISIRPKEPEDRRLNVKPGQAWVFPFASFFPPLLILIGGIMVWLRRR